MTETRSTKRAFLASVVALVLCIAMLLGTTYAWFTDSVISSGNIIKSGTLDVTMEYADGKVDPATATWTDASDVAIFNYDLWEPGYTEVKHVKIANIGTLALKYKVAIEANGEVSELANVIDVYYVDPAVQVVSRADLTESAKLGTLKEALDGLDATAAGNLAAGESDIITIALKMQESAGNEYQNLAIGTDFNICLYATQDTVEADSFDNQYDANLTPLAADDVLKTIDGIQYVYSKNGDITLRLVTPEYDDDVVKVMDGTTSIGNYAFAYNDNVKEVVLSSTVRSLGRGFDSSTVEKVVLNEGLKQIDSRAFKSTSNLKEVVISSTVKTIADNAFQKSGIKEIVIPATVETVGETAFGASMIETVTFEGNTSIQGYAFRGCKELRTVYMKGEDVTFVQSTLNGRNSTWFCNGESNNPNTSNISFYVENETVAERVKKAMGAEANNTKIYVDGKITVKVDSADNFKDALADAAAGTVIDASGVTLEPTGSASTTVNIPAGVTVKGASFIPNSNAYLLIGEGNKPVVFEDCSFDGVDRSTYVIGTNGCGNVTFTNCAFNGQIMPNATVNADATFNFDNCTFGLSEGSGSIGYVNCMGGTHNFKNCTFDFTGGATYGSNQYVKWNAVNSYSEKYSTKVILEGCTFINCGTQRYGSNSTLTVK